MSAEPQNGTTTVIAASRAAWFHSSAKVAATPAALAVGVFWLAFDHGAYGISTWTSAAVVVWSIVLVSIVVGNVPRGHLSRGTLWTAALLTVFAFLHGLSAVWASGAETPLLWFARSLLYVGILVSTLLLVTRRTVGRCCDAVTAGLVGIAILALFSRCFPLAFSTNATRVIVADAHTRLSYPVGYWNGLAILAGLACPLLLRGALVWRRRLAPIAVMPLPGIVGIAYLASSRTGFLSIIAGVAVFIALSDRRWLAAAATVAGLIGSVIAVAWIVHESVLTGGPLRSPEAVTEGRQTAAVLVVAALVAAVLFLLLRRLLERAQPPSGAGRVVLIVLALVVLVAAVTSHPVRRWHDFTQRPPALTSTSYINQHFLSSNGNWRYQFWRSTVDEFRTRPVLGKGAGSFEAWWDRTGTGFSSNPHSLLFETLGDLGLVGVITLIAAFAAGVGTAVQRTLRAKNDVRQASAAALAGFVAFALAAGVEWLWELPAVAAVGILLLGLALAPEEQRRNPVASKGRLRLVLPIGLSVAALAFLALELDLHLANSKLSSSQAAAARGDLVAAGTSARAARRYEPWAASPYLQLALIDESAKRYTAARAAIENGLDRQKDDWRLWIVASRIEAHLGDVSAARQSRDRAVALNPRSAALVSPGPG